MNIDQFLVRLVDVLINPIILLLFALAVLYFLYGVLKYIRNAADSSKRAEGANHILYGLIGMAIMIGVYKILDIITSSIF